MKRGISLMALVATIAIILIIVTTATVSGVNTANKSKKIAFGTEINMIKSMINTYINLNGEYPYSDVITLSLDKVEEKTKLQFDGENIIDNKLSLNTIDYQKIGVRDLKYGSGNTENGDIYLYSKDTGRVYYAKGLLIGNNVYYTVTSDISNLMNSKNKNMQIVFELSTFDYTSENINFVVKVPKNYIDVSVYINDVSLNTQKSDNIYNIYEVIVEENSTVEVTYKENELSDIMKTRYKISNIDKVEPSFSVNIKEATVITDNNRKIAFIKISDLKDDVSGIKKIKYETYRVDTNIKEYFENNGKDLVNNSLVIDKNITNFTVYAEDNAGNWFAQFVNVDSDIMSKLK